MSAKKDLREEICNEAQELRNKSKQQIPIDICTVLAASRSYDGIKYLEANKLNLLGNNSANLNNGVYTCLYNTQQCVFYLRVDNLDKGGSNMVSGNSNPPIGTNTSSIKGIDVEKSPLNVVWDHGAGKDKRIYATLCGFQNVYVMIGLLNHTSNSKYSITPDIQSEHILGWMVNGATEATCAHNALTFNRSASKNPAETLGGVIAQMLSAPPTVKMQSKK